VQTHEAVGTLRGGRHLRDRQRRGVRGEQRLPRARLVERLVHLALQLEVLDDGLDHDLAGAQLSELGRPPQPRQHFLHALRLQLPLVDALLQEGFDLRQALLQQLVRDLANHDVVPGLGADLRDPRAHQPASDDSDRPDRHAASRSRIIAMPWPPPIQALARP
jgi:hypothetical protein